MADGHSLGVHSLAIEVVFEISFEEKMITYVFDQTVQNFLSVYCK